MMIILILGIMAFIGFVSIGWLIESYNFFMTTKEAVDSMWSNIVTEYERRVDLFVNLAKNVKSFSKHEKETFSNIAQMRSGGIKGTPKQQMKQLHQMDSMISGLKINVEAYPELKANGLYDNFMNEIRITEDRINAGRTGYNTVVREFESRRVSFPDNMIAKMFNIKEIKYYHTERKDVTGKAPVVDV